MTREELTAFLPHRDAMLLVDRAEVRDGVAYGEILITGGEWFLKGHFPGNPVVPGVILCEIMAQSSCVLLASGLGGRTATLLTGLDDVRFKNPVVPGDVFRVECVLKKIKAPFYWASGKGYVNGKLCVSANFSFAVYPG